ncbi:MAG TPA: hypothetical protein VMF06_07100 [Candidatus Limnocylindria bacterium]|jgi:hypothetical protein|nr:hypothetical protein [Candidatus Limnocylindria bacterium]
MTQTNLIEDLRLLPIPPWYRTPWGLAGLAVLLAVAGFLVWRWWSRRRPRAATEEEPLSGPPPDEAFLKRLAALKDRQGGMSAYDMGIEVSSILRGYLEARFRYRILYQTTREFLGSVRADSRLTVAQRDRIDAFLSLCDGVKFARQPATAEERDGLLSTAESVIRECAKAK